MRGTPFGFSAWHLGLNTIDSPFTLVEGETRECLNVVSTERGAIKKRTGSVQFVSGKAGTPPFPNLAITDSFNRFGGSEKPLSKEIKGEVVRWEAITGATNTGRVLNNHWRNDAVAGSTSGALWNKEEVSTPAVSLEISTPPTLAERFVCVWCCLSKAAKSGYRVTWEVETEKTFQVTIEKWETGVKTVLATATKQTLKENDSIGISLGSEIIRAWRKTGGIWSQIAESPKDAKYTKGYGGIEMAGEAASTAKNFAVGTYAAGEGIESEITSLAYVNIGGTPYLIAAAGKNLYSITAAGEVNTIGESFTEGKQWSIVQYQKGKAKETGTVFLQNGSDTPQTWKGTEAKTKVEEWKSEEAEIEVLEKRKVKTVKTPKGKYMTTHLGRVWIANTVGAAPDGGSTVRCNEANEKEEVDPSIWPEKNYIQLDPEDGYEITGIGNIGPYVIVFKPYKCWIIHAAAGINPIAVRQLSENTGCVSHRSITETPMGTFFLTADQGVYLTNGSRLTEMSYKVRPTILKINGANREKAAGAFFNNHFYLSYPDDGSGLPNRTLDYDVALKSWWLHDIASNQWAEAELNTGEPFLYVAKPKTKEGIARAFVEGVFTDAIEGVAKAYRGSSDYGLSAFWISPWEPFFYFIFRHRIKAPFIKKRVRQLFFDGSGEVILFQFKSFHTAMEQIPATVNNNSMNKPELPINFVEPGGLWGEGELVWGEGEEQWGGTAVAGRARAYALGTATEWSFGFGNNTKEPFEITYATYMAQFRKS